MICNGEDKMRKQVRKLEQKHRKGNLRDNKNLHEETETKKYYGNSSKRT